MGYWSLSSLYSFTLLGKGTKNKIVKNSCHQNKEFRRSGEEIYACMIDNCIRIRRWPLKRKKMKSQLTLRRGSAVFALMKTVISCHNANTFSMKNVFTSGVSIVQINVRYAVKG